MTTIIYSRVSSTTDRQNTDRQVSDLTAYAEANGLRMLKVFSEHISGAKQNTERPVLAECLQYAKKNKVNMILFSELSRLGRNVLNVIEVVKWLSDNAINAYFQKENLMLLDASGKVQPTTTILISCLGMVAEIERENISFRLNSGRRQAIEKGVRMGRKVGFRYTTENYERKYPVAISLIRKGYKLIEIKAIAESKGEKVSKSTLTTLKKMFNSI